MRFLLDPPAATFYEGKHGQVLRNPENRVDGFWPARVPTSFV